MSDNEQAVCIGSSVKLREHGTKNEETFQVVENSQADVLENKIPAENPMGQALLGKTPGDKVPLNGPEGEVEFSVLEVTQD